jgi:glycosyltransferase involved in cell wall biosynthesis
MPNVSVVIQTYNCAAFLSAAIESVLAQTYKDFQILVVDDGSTDETSEVIAPYLDRVTFIQHENRGVAVARNAGSERLAESSSRGSTQMIPGSRRS